MDSESQFTKSVIQKLRPGQIHPSLVDRISRRAYAQAYFGGPNRGVMRAVWTIISLNAAVFGAWQYAKAKNDRALDRQLYENATLMEANLQAGRNHTLFTSAFSHREPGHFLFNMVSFHAFGSVLATVSGVRAAHVIALAVGSAAAGSVAWFYHLRTSKRPQSTIQRSKGVFSSFGGGQIVRHIYVGLGASGMVMGLGAAATCLRPNAPMNLMFIPISIPLWAITALYFGVDAYYLNSDSKVGHSAHLGGAVFGAAFYLLALRNRGGIWTMLRRGLRR